MSNVHKLTGQPLPGEVNADLINALRDILARAERGEITSAAWVHCSGPVNDTVATGWEGAGGSSFALHSGITTLCHRFTASLSEDCTCP